MATILFNPLGPPFDFSETTGGGSTINTLTGNDGVVVVPSGGNANIVGEGIASSGLSIAGNIYVSGAGSTLTINETQAQFVTNYRETAVSSAVQPTDYLIGCTAAGITITLPANPAITRLLVIKDESGGATASPIIVAGNGNNIDGQADISLDQNFYSINMYYSGLAWFSF